MEQQQEQVKTICDICHGFGVVTTMERVSSEDPRLAPVGEEPCECQNTEEDDFSGATDGDR